MTTTDVRDARVTGIAYLLLALAGGLAFLVVRAQLYDPADAAVTLTRLRDREALARVGIALELVAVLAQAVAALWFFRLFRGVDAFAAGCIAAFGLINATAVLVSAALLGVALGVAAEPFGDAAATAQLAYLASDRLWSAGGVFFGLWLLPMGWCVLREQRVLGWLLIGGGAGYLLSTFADALGAGAVADPLTLPATAGEIWMIGRLLTRRVASGTSGARTARR